MDKELSVFLRRPGQLGMDTGVDIALPVTLAELRDAFDKARITDEQTIYYCTLDETGRDFLLERIPEQITNLPELNLLAEILAGMEDWQSICFEGLCMMEGNSNNERRIPVAELINMTYSVDDCQLAFDVADDKALGKFYDENDMLPDTDGLPENVRALLDFEALGRNARLSEGGVFVARGYVVHSSTMSQKYDGKLCAYPKSVSAESFFMLYPTLQSTAGDEEHEALSGLMSNISENGDMVKLKALIAATHCESAADAIILAKDIDNYLLDGDITSRRCYALESLCDFYPGLTEDELSKSVNLDYFGRILMEKEQSAFTEYGIVCRRDNQPMPDFSHRDDQEASIESIGQQMI